METGILEQVEYRLTFCGYISSFRLGQKPRIIRLLPWLNVWLSHALVALNLAGAQPAQSETNAYADYAGSKSCRDCHLNEYNLWAQSNHALAERLLNPITDRRAFDPSRDLKLGHEMTMAEMGVGCESCHGPLKAHNEWQNAHPKTTMHDPTVSPLSPVRVVGLCGSCHSRNTDLKENFKPGDSFYDHYALETLDYGEHWYPDGQIKDEDYEFEAFVGSKMYQAGVTWQVSVLTNDMNNA